MKKLLIVDDDPLVAAALARLFRRHNCSVALAYGAEEALERLPKFQPDVVLSDVMMPKMNGVDLLTRVRALLPAARCILISGYADEEQTRPSGFVLISKPWDEAALLRACGVEP